MSDKSLEMELIGKYLWVGFALVWALWAVRTKRTEQRESVASRLFYSLFLMAGFYLIFARKVPLLWLRRPILPRDAWVHATGIVVTAAGLLFAIWARFHLGTNWSGTVTVKVGHELVRSGPYHWVRHPIYSGLLLAIIGTGVERGETRSIVAFLLACTGFLVKLRREEKFMNATFGAQYEEYRRSTGALIPRLRD